MPRLPLQPAELGENAVYDAARLIFGVELLPAVSTTTDSGSSSWL